MTIWVIVYSYNMQNGQEKYWFSMIIFLLLKLALVCILSNILKIWTHLMREAYLNFMRYKIYDLQEFFNQRILPFKNFFLH